MLNLVFMVSMPMLTMILFESIYRRNMFDTFSWFVEQPGEMLLNYILFFGLINIFYFLPRKIYLSVASFVLLFFSLLGFVSSYKVERRGEPILPWDVALTKEAFNISVHLDGIINVVTIGIAIFLVGAVVVLVKFIPKEIMMKFDKETKMFVSLVSLVLFFVYFNGYTSAEEKMNISLMTWDQKMNYEENGHLLGFVLNTRDMKVEKPDVYNKERVDQIVEESVRTQTNEKEKNPNIIFIQSEAFWDPTRLESVEFSQDPIPFFRSLTQKYIHGNLYSPVFGGNTANTEFEILTGYSTQLLPKGVIPYVQYVHEPMESLATVLAEQNYHTTGIHPYNNWFYGRDKVYNNLGFEKFISEEFFNGVEKRRGYVTDESFVQRILEEVKETDEKDFVYGVSMEGHGPYYYDEAVPSTISVTGDISETTKNTLETYAQTMSWVDKSLESLINGVNALGEPTIVVFYGDHLPMLGESYAAYKETGFFENEAGYEDYKKSHEVPFVIWDNFTEANTSKQIDMSASFLAPYVLDLIDKKGTKMFDFLQNIAETDGSLLLRHDFWEKEGIQKESIDKYSALQYDLLFGQRFATNGKTYVSSNKFTLGEEVTIKETVPRDIQAGVSFNEKDGKSVLGIKGENFFENLILYVNGEALKTEFHDANYITVTLPNKFYKEKGVLTFQLKAKDSLKTTISESNELKIQVIESLNE